MGKKEIREMIRECLSDSSTVGQSQDSVSVIDMGHYVRLSPKAARILAGQQKRTWEAEHGWDEHG